MKAILFLLILPILACGPSQAQLQGERDYYQARVAMAAQRAAQPLFELVSSDAAKPIVLNNVAAIRVYQPSQGQVEDFKQYVHQDYAAKWVGLIGQTVGIAAPWLGAWGIVNSIKDMGATTTQTISGTGNAAAAHSPYATFAVSPPTVVEQPPPLVVRPEVVNPVVVDPVVVKP